MTVSSRAFHPEDLPEVLALLTASLGESPLLRRTPELFAWKHRENPFGDSVVLLATVGDRIAGLRAVMRWELVHPSGDRIRCGRMVDTATHPDFQRMGIFRRLTMESLEEAGGRGIQLIFNTPNPQSGAGYLKMGWQRAGTIGVMVRPSFGMFRPTYLPNDLLPDPGDFVTDPKPVGDLVISDREPLGFRTPRSKAYLHWRFVSHPTARYVQLSREGATVLARPNHRSGRRELVISELLGGSPRQALRDLIRQSKADYAVGWFSRRSPERAAAARCGLVPVPRVGALELMVRPLVEDLPQTVTDLAGWDLSIGDLELL